jgi:hypothetical protein
MAASPLLLAAFADVVWVLIALASFAVWVYNQIKKANEEAAKKAQGPPLQPVAPSPPAPPRGQPPPVRGQQPRQRKAARPAPGDRPALSSTTGSEEDPWAKGEGVATHVRRHLDTQEFDQRAGSFGQLSHLDTEVDDHVHEAFDHEVTTIDDQGAVTEAERQFDAPAEAALAASAAAGIAELFADPDRLRNAIILQEVLRPPQWDEGGR